MNAYLPLQAQNLPYFQDSPVGSLCFIILVFHCTKETAHS